MRLRDVKQWILDKNPSSRLMKKRFNRAVTHGLPPLLVLDHVLNGGAIPTSTTIPESSTLQEESNPSQVMIARNTMLEKVFGTNHSDWKKEIKMTNRSRHGTNLLRNWNKGNRVKKYGDYYYCKARNGANLNTCTTDCCDGRWSSAFPIQDTVGTKHILVLRPRDTVADLKNQLVHKKLSSASKASDIRITDKQGRAVDETLEIREVYDRYGRDGNLLTYDPPPPPPTSSKPSKKKRKRTTRVQAVPLEPPESTFIDQTQQPQPPESTFINQTPKPPPQQQQPQQQQVPPQQQLPPQQKLPQQPPPLQQKYASELAQMREKGFTNTQKNIETLDAQNGNVTDAINALELEKELAA